MGDTAAVLTSLDSAAAGVSDCEEPRPAEQPGTRVIAIYYACDGPVPGQLYAVYRRVPEGADPVHAAIEQLLRGPTEEERRRGFWSLFSSETAGMLRGISRNAGGDTVTINFADFRDALRESPIPASFGPGGVMAEITWTIFRQFPQVQALRFAFDGSEEAFWSWLGGASAKPQAFTRADWERV